MQTEIVTGLTPLEPTTSRREIYILRFMAPLGPPEYGEA
jgi:hypothetical protein